LDTVETPEGSKIGLQKHLSLLADVTLHSKSQELIIDELLEDKLIDLKDVHPYEFNKNNKVFLNGNWLGFTNNSIELVNFLKNKRAKGFINHHTSIVYDIYNKEIKIYSDGGRMIRPLLTVKDNKLNLTKDMINNIDLTGVIKNKVNRWNQFMLEYTNIIEYVDVEESEYLMIAMKVKDLDLHKKRMTLPVKNPNESGDKINRYNDTVYVKHTHCEFHPCMMLGTSSACIPFADHNQAPRNIYNFSQSKQGKGIYVTNERYRMDITYRLANPSYPLIQTRAMKYLKTNDLSNGENVVVAIACYSGYNQEDSLIFNQSSLDRGLFRSYVYKKYTDEIKKNPSTSQDDKFAKPDPSKVSGIRKANYEKLNNLGYVPVETKIENGDVIIGKISPIDPGADNQAKIYKDNSQVYKANVSANIEKVYTGIYNNDGYEMYAVQVRSERIPNIGDKFASRHGQKGTCGIVLPAADMPFTKDGVQPDVIMNPNAVPSRMTVGQLLECVLGKVSALRGQFSEATPFNDYDIQEACDILKSYGFNEHGFEDLYCGMSGKKIRSQIFIGPTYYMRLKHLVQDKIHSRARGPRQVLTRQPPEGRARDGGLRFGEMERDCWTMDALITLSNGLSMKIKNMENNKIGVLGFDEKKNGLVKSKQIDFMNKGTRPCVELTMEDGRKTTCTEDHPLLTENNEWITAKDLVINQDRLKVGITCPELDIEEEIIECGGWELKLDDLTLKTDNKDNYLKTLAFARIIGLLITDGHITNKNEGIVYLGHKLDVEQFFEDLNMFCNNNNYIKQEHCYTVNLPQVFMKNILKLNGLTIGRKVNQKAVLPEFVNTCPKSILREFLGGMFGGDGHTCFLGLHRGKRDLLSSVGFSQSKTEENIESLNDMMEQIKELLYKFDINDVTIQKPKEISDSKNKENNDKVYEIVLHIALDNLILFSQNIGFRYCCHKLQRLEAGVSYKRLRTETIRQHNWIVNRVDEITNYKTKKLADPSKNVQTKNAISQAVKELTENEPLIHEYVIPTTHDISDHLIKGTKFGSFRSGSFPTAEEFLKKINILDWFLDDSETAYGVQRQKDCLPTMNMKVIGIKPVGDKPVYDISVDKTHSFLAEGVVAHNCMIAHGMGQFLKERLVNTSDQYYVHVCSNCGLFARKKPDKDIYICQMCNIRNQPYTTHKIEIPYAFKLLIQELTSINILPRIKVDTDIYNEQPSMHT
jgi:intein/homing endonuclease